MKHIICALMLIYLCGCTAGQRINRNFSSVQFDQQMVASVGEVLFREEIMTGQDNGGGSAFDGNASAYDLTITGISSSLLKIQYNEYSKPAAGPYGGYRINEPWLVRPAFSQALEFDITNKSVRYKSLEFTVISAEGGRLVYKRVK